MAEPHGKSLFEQRMNDIEKLDAFGREYGIVIYNVHQCSAGWGVMWYEGDAQTPPISRGANSEWREHLHVYDYYRTVDLMIEAETARLHAWAKGHSKTRYLDR